MHQGRGGRVEIDWSGFPDQPDQTIDCQCGAIYRSHAKLVTIDGKLVMYTRMPCPQCGKDHGHTRATYSDPERMVIRGG